MAEARKLKQREYGTDVLSHPDQNVVDYDRRTRYNNTTKSNAFHNEPDHQESQRLANKRNNNFAEKPLKGQVARASYQDSNIFGYKNAEGGTVQASAVGPGKQVQERQQNTFASQAFAQGGDNSHKGRDQNTFKSGIFGSDVTANAGRKRLGGASSGTASLFGEDRPDYQRSSHNGMVEAPKALYRPEKPVADMRDAKAKEVYGNSATAYGFNKNKRDGALMSAGADWTNSGQSSVNKSSPLKGKNVARGASTRDSKYAQLQSSVFGGGYMDGEQPDYDREAGRNVMGSAADWKTSAGMAKPVNVGSTNVDTFRQRQKQLASSVLEQTDHTGHAPLNKKGIDNDNYGHQHKVQAKGRVTDNEFKQRVQGFEPARKNYDGYNAGDQKQGNLASSAFDNHPRPATGNNRRGQRQQENTPASFTIQGRETKATKQAMLASNDPISGASSLTAYNANKAPSEIRVVDLELKNLGEGVDKIEVKKMSGARHVISVALDEDNMKGICRGTGRIQIRLNQNENLDDIQLNFASKGVMVNEHSGDPRKKPNMTGGGPKQFAKEITNTKNRKQAFLQTTGGGIFGEGGQYQVDQ